MRGAVVGARVGGGQTSADTGGTAPAAALAQRQWAGLAALAALGVSDHQARVPDRAEGDYDHRSEGTPALLRYRLAYGLLLAGSPAWSDVITSTTPGCWTREMTRRRVRYARGSASNISPGTESNA